MPYQANWEERGVYLRFYGDTTDQEVAGSSRKGQGDPRFEQIRYVILDFRDCSSVQLTKGVLEELAATDMAASRTNPNIKIAVIAKQPDALEMVSSYLSTGIEAYPLRVFQAQDQARAWAQEKRSG